MSERSIAEIIGWEWRGQRQYEIEMHGFRVDAGDLAVYYGPETGRGYWAPPGVEVLDLACFPNSDDLLAWLLSRPAFVFENTFYGPMTMWGSVNGFVVTMTDADGDDVSSDCHPTLLAALGQLVRLIDNYERENADG